MIHFSASEMRNKGRTGVSHFKKRYALRQDVGYVEKKSSLCVMSLNVNGLTQSSVHDIEAAVNVNVSYEIRTTNLWLCSLRLYH